MSSKESQPDTSSLTGSNEPNTDANSKTPSNSASVSFWSRYRLPILSGLLVGTSYIPFPPWALFFCLVPLFLFWLRAPSKKVAFFGGWITQFILNLIGFHWIAYTASEFGHFPWWGGVLTLLGFAAIAHLHYPIAGWLTHIAMKRFKLSPMATFLFMAFAFCLCDRLYPMIFPWHLGYPWLWANLPGAQFADVIGFEGLNYITIFVNMLIAIAVNEGLLIRENPSRTRAIKFAAVGVAIVVIVNLLGLGRANFWKETDAELNVIAVQGNIGNFEKFMVEERADFRVPVLEKYLRLTREALDKHPEAQLAIWPETAYPTFLNKEYLQEPLQRRLRDFLVETKTPLMAGAYSRQFGTRKVYNGLFYLNAAGLLGETPYHKSILLVFGETFPLSEYIPYMDKFFPDQGGFERGGGPTVMNLKLDGKNTGEVAIGPQICYEGLYPWFSASLARQGAEVIANVTNDSWFWRPFEPNQHLYMTFARAVEFRRPLFRSTNTGITTAILASGEVLQKSPIGEEWTGLFKIPYRKNPPHTFYERAGHLWPWALLVFLVLVIAGDRLILSRIKLLSGRG